MVDLGYTTYYANDAGRRTPWPCTASTPYTPYCDQFSCCQRASSRNHPGIFEQRDKEWYKRMGHASVTMPDGQSSLKNCSCSMTPVRHYVVASTIEFCLRPTTRAIVAPCSSGPIPSPMLHQHSCPISARRETFPLYLLPDLECPWAACQLHCLVVGRS